MATPVTLASAGVRTVCFGRSRRCTVKCSTKKPAFGTEKPLLSQRLSSGESRTSRTQHPRSLNSTRIVAVDRSPERNSSAEDSQDFVPSFTTASFDELIVPTIRATEIDVDEDLSPFSLRERLTEYEQWAEQRERERARVLAALQDAAERRAEEDARNIAASQERIAELASKAKHLQELRTRSEQLHAQERERMVEKFEAQRETLQAQIAKQREDNLVVSEKHRTLQAVVDARSSSLADVKAELAATQEQYRHAADKHQKLELKLTEITKYSEEMRTIIKSLEHQRTELEGTLSEKEAAMAEERARTEAQVRALEESLVEQRAENEAEMAKWALERESAEQKLRSLQEVVQTQTGKLNAALNDAIQSGKQAVVSAKKIKTLTAEIATLEAAVEDQKRQLDEQTVARDAAERQVFRFKDTMDATKAKLDELMTVMGQQVAAAHDLQEGAAAEQEAMLAHAKELQEVVEASTARTAAQKAEVVGVTREEVTKAAKLMDEHVKQLRRVAGLGDPSEVADPVGSLRAALQHGEEVAVALTALDSALREQAAAVEEQAADKEFVSRMKRVVGDMRAVRDAARGPDQLEAEVGRLRGRRSGPPPHPHRPRPRPPARPMI